MRFAAVTLCWLLATAALAVAVPAVWLQRTVIDTAGYTRQARAAAADPTLQTAVADQLTGQVVRLFRDHRYDLAPSAVRDVTSAYTAGPAFGEQFAQVNRGLHDWQLSGGGSGGGSDTALVDVAPMLRDDAFAPLLSEYNIAVPATLAIPVRMPHPGGLRPVADWAGWLAAGSTLLAAGAALLTVAVAGRRGRALAGLGVSALLVGAAGWAGIEIGRDRLNHALNLAAVDIRQIAGALLDSAQASLHHWLNATLAVGAGLVVAGVVVAAAGGWIRTLRSVHRARRREPGGDRR